MSLPQFNSLNPTELLYESENLKITVMGGIRIDILERMCKFQSK